MYRCIFSGECSGCGECQAHHITTDDYDEDQERDVYNEMEEEK